MSVHRRPTKLIHNKFQIPKGFMINEEVELGVIINTKVKNVSEKDAMDTVGGFCVALDMTATCRLVQTNFRTFHCYTNIVLNLAKLVF